MPAFCFSFALALFGGDGGGGIQVLRNEMGVGVRISSDLLYEVISVTRGWVGVKFCSTKMAKRTFPCHRQVVKEPKL